MQNLDINKCENVGMYLRYVSKYIYIFKCYIYVVSEPYKTGTEEKIKSILKIGLVNGHDSIVLGAFGCGAFGNPPKHIAALFEKVNIQPAYRYAYLLFSF